MILHIMLVCWCCRGCSQHDDLKHNKTVSSSGLSRVITPSHPIVASPGGDIILPCHLEPAADAVSMTVEWTRPDLEPRFVHLWRSGQELLNDQNVAFKGRTFLFINKLKQGDLSLKLSEVKFSDEGTYRCFMPMLNTDSTVQLVVRECAYVNNQV